MTSWSEVLLAEATAGDAAAIEELRLALPTKLPERVRQGRRERLIRRLASLMACHSPGVSLTAISHDLAEIGAAVEGGRSLAALDIELGDDRAAVEGLIRALIDTIEADGRSNRAFPCSRTIRSILLSGRQN